MTAITKSAFLIRNELETINGVEHSRKITILRVSTVREIPKQWQYNTAPPTRIVHQCKQYSQRVHYICEVHPTQCCIIHNSKPELNIACGNSNAVLSVGLLQPNGKQFPTEHRYYVLHPTHTSLASTVSDKGWLNPGGKSYDKDSQGMYLDPYILSARIGNTLDQNHKQLCADLSLTITDSHIEPQEYATRTTQYTAPTQAKVPCNYKLAADYSQMETVPTRSI